MRVWYFFLFALIVTALVVFAVQNNESITVHYLNQSVTARLSVVLAAVYLLGMLSGWTVVGIVRRSMERVTDRPRD